MIKLPNWEGLPGVTSTPASASFFFTSGIASTACISVLSRSTTGLGRLAGPISPNHTPMSTPLSAGVSASAGTFGATAARLAPVTP
ncbi:hypothetical protein D3C72_1164620 [compost metagenome]